MFNSCSKLSSYHKFSLLSSLKPNKAKCEIVGIGVLKGVSLALCGIDCIDLMKKTIKILGIHFSYNKKLKLKRTLSGMVRKQKKY